MSLNLKKPIAFIDIEATGLRISKDRIIEIAMLKVTPNGEQAMETKRLNPTIKIPEESIKIHGITNEDVKDCPSFEKEAQNIANYLEGCDLGGFNSNKFDIPMLVEEFLRTDVAFDMEGRKLVDVQKIFHRMEPRNLKAAYRFYCDKELEDAHTAEADITATYEILLQQLDHYEEDLENDIDFLHEFSNDVKRVDFAGRMIYNKEGKEIFNFGKHRGKPVAEILDKEPQYYDWIMKKDFPLDTKRKLTNIKLRAFNQG